VIKKIIFDIVIRKQEIKEMDAFTLRGLVVILGSEKQGEVAIISIGISYSVLDVTTLQSVVNKAFAT